MGIEAMDTAWWRVVWFTVGCGLLSTLLVMVPAMPLAYALARFKFPGRNVLAALCSLPLVLPPTAVGFILLRMLADGGWLGRDRLGFDPELLFTWRGVIVACAVMSLPLMVRTLRVSFEEVNPRLEQIARTLGRGKFLTFLTITIPLAWRGILAATILGFTRAMGEFGATVMVAGNIPGQTQTIASAIYSAQQAGNEQRAGFLVLIALTVGFSAIFAAEWLARPRTPAQGAK